MTLRAQLVAAFLTAHNAFLAALCRLLFRPSARVAVPRRILVFRTAALGDFILTLPAFALLRSRFRDAQILLLTAPASQQGTRAQVGRYAEGGHDAPWLSLAVPSLVDRALVWRAARIPAVLREIRPAIREFDPDLAFVIGDVAVPLANIVRKLVFLRLAGVRGPVYGWRRHASRALLGLGTAASARFEHHVMGPIRSVSEHPDLAQADRVAAQFPVDVPASAHEWAGQLWRDSGWDGGTVVALAPGSIQPHKRWPLEHYLELCHRLCVVPGVHVAVIGTRDDAHLGETLAAQLPDRVKNLAGATSIRQSAALLARSALLVGNDGGAMHLGAAVGCRVVSIIPGIELPGAVDPWGSEAWSVRNPVPCAPCYNFTYCPAGHNRCMVDVPVERVFAACARALEW